MADRPGKINLILVFAVALLTVLLILAVQQSCTRSDRYKEIKKAVTDEVAKIKEDIKASETRDNALMQGQKELKKTLKDPGGILDKLTENKKTVDDLDKKLDELPKVKNSKDFKTLPECQKGYHELTISYQTCLDLNKARKNRLNLFNQVYENMNKQNTLLEGSINELKSQIAEWKKIEKTVSKGMDDLDKAHRTKKFFRDVKNVGLGAAAGALLAVLLKLVK
jgi:chromosome segregation ATPase